MSVNAGVNNHLTSAVQFGMQLAEPCKLHTQTHTRLTALFGDYPGEPVPEK